jgi:hypothetical protein
MNKIAVKKVFLSIFSLASVGYPLWISLSKINWTLNATLLTNMFPAFGILAFTLLWLHAISGVFEPWLRKQIDFDRFVHITSIIILVSIILHPLLLLIMMGSTFAQIIYGGKFIWLGIIGWLLLITYDIGKYLNKYNFFVRHWNKILVISTIGFLLTFFHSLNLGSDLQTNPLRSIWIFYGITAIIATIYTYGIKRL